MNCLQVTNIICTLKWKGKLKALRKHNRPLRNPELECSLDDQMEYLYEWLPTQIN